MLLIHAHYMVVIHFVIKIVMLTVPFSNHAVVATTCSNELESIKLSHKIASSTCGIHRQHTLDWLGIVSDVVCWWST